MLYIGLTLVANNYIRSLLMLSGATVRKPSHPLFRFLNLLLQAACTHILYRYSICTQPDVRQPYIPPRLGERTRSRGGSGEMEKKMEKVECEPGVATVIKFPERKEAYVIHSPSFWETGVKVAEQLMEEGWRVFRLNTGNEDEAEEAERLIERYCPDA